MIIAVISIVVTLVSVGYLALMGQWWILAAGVAILLLQGCRLAFGHWRRSRQMAVTLAYGRLSEEEKWAFHMEQARSQLGYPEDPFPPDDAENSPPATDATFDRQWREIVFPAIEDALKAGYRVPWTVLEIHESSRRLRERTNVTYEDLQISSFCNFAMGERFGYPSESAREKVMAWYAANMPNGELLFREPFDMQPSSSLGHK